MSVEAHDEMRTPVHYFDLPYYAGVHAMVERWHQLGEIDKAVLPSLDIRAECERLLFLEARLIDAGRLREWLELYTADCGYWIPSDIGGGSPAKVVSWEFNDRRRLEERVERLGTGYAYSQMPTTRTRHLYTNIEMMVRDDHHVEVLCNFQIQAVQGQRHSQRAGWNGFVLRKTAAGWRIVLKRIALFDADLPQNDNSFTL